jgi:hypothetical protein
MHTIVGMRLRVPAAVLATALLIVAGSTRSGMPVAAPVAGADSARASIADGYAGPGAAQSKASASTAGTPRQPPSSATLIERAAAAGRISQARALVYRLEAMSGDPRLPAAYAGQSQEDLAAIVSAYWTKGQLGPKEAARVARYLARPTDVRANEHAVAALPNAQAAVFVPGSSAAGARPASPVQGDCTDGNWVSQAGQHPFRVWLNCTGSWVEDLRRAVSTMDVQWGAMTGVMGEPLPDDGTGGDSRMDIYLVSGAAQCVPGRDPCYRLRADEAGRAVPTGPDDGARTSAFLVLPRSVVATPQLLSTLLAHEFFHALQFAHNARGLFTNTASHWFVEATAEWAQSAFARETAAEMVYRPQFVDRFQRFDAPLNRSDNAQTGDGYRAFIWPYFMQQESAADPAIIGAAWRALEGAYNFAAADQALNSVFSFADHFRDFAFRNLNRDFLPGSPIVPRYADMDPTFPSNAEPEAARRRPVNSIAVEASAAPPVQYREHLDLLTSHYWVFVVDPAVRQIDLNLSGLTGGNPVADAAVLSDHGAPFSGQWERIRLGAGRTTWCRDDPARDISLIFLVVSNAAYQGTPVDGSIEASGMDHCARASGTLTWTQSWSVPASEGHGAASGHVQITLDLRFDRVADHWVDAGSSWSATGTQPLPDVRLGPGDGGCLLTDRAISYRSNGTFARAGPRSPPGLILQPGRAGRTTVQLRIDAVAMQVQTVAGRPECSPGPRASPLLVVWRPDCGDSREGLALPARPDAGRTIIVGCHGMRGFVDPGGAEGGVAELDLGGSLTLRPVVR